MECSYYCYYVCSIPRTTTTTTMCSAPSAAPETGNRVSKLVKRSNTKRKAVKTDTKTILRLNFLRGSSFNIGTIQRRLAWPLRKDDTHKSRSVNKCPVAVLAQKRSWQAVTRVPAHLPIATGAPDDTHKSRSVNNHPKVRHSRREPGPRGRGRVRGVGADYHYY